jgi:pimeloyl-ACP methyl ester carboxylesterase
MTASTDKERARAFPAGRIVALVLIGLAVLGLAYLKLGAADDPISVPAGAVAGDLLLDPCTYSTESGNYAADCGTLIVPESRADPESRLIAVPVTRIHARSENPGEPIFRLEGGPGLTNMDFPRASRFAENHDVVLVGYRGVEGSSVLDCPEVESALKHSTDILSDKSFDAYADGFRACSARLTDEGVDLAGYTLAQRVDDLEAVRKALDYGRIDLLSESVGTRTAMIYAWRYPESIHRSVMIGVNPPGHFLWDPKMTNELIGRYSDHCSEDATCSKRTEDLAALMRGTEVPERWFFLPIKDSSVRVASFYGLAETTYELDAPIYGSTTLSSWLSAADDDASGFWFQSFLGDFAFPVLGVWGDYAAVAMADAQAAKAYFSSGKQGDTSNLGYSATAFVWGGGQLADAWPAEPGDDEYTAVQASNVETLLIGGELDFATPPQAATEELLPSLPNGHQVVLPGFGHSTSFWTEQPKAGTRLISTFLSTGRVDDSLYEPQPVDFTPEVAQPALGKGIGGGIVGLAGLVVLSLLWMPLHVLRRGRYGRKTSAMLRSVYATVLGLGGWFVGVLLVMTTMPGTPFGDPLLATLSVGLPIGLGVYWAWVHRDWSMKAKAAGFAAAGVGALAGAWLGYQAAADLLALITAIVGATAGANLILLVFDISWDRRARDRFVETNEKEVLKASLSTR